MVIEREKEQERDITFSVSGEQPLPADRSGGSEIFYVRSDFGDQNSLF